MYSRLLQYPNCPYQHNQCTGITPKKIYPVQMRSLIVFILQYFFENYNHSFDYFTIYNSVFLVYARPMVGLRVVQ